MKLLKMLSEVLCVTMLVIVFAPRVRSDAGNKLTYFTFSAPVELPGMTLPGGTYAFTVLDSAGTRNIVQVFDKNKTHLYGTFLTIPDYHTQASDKTIIRFSETAEGGPPAIKEWFYPGDNYGEEFVYPKNRATQLAKASNQAVPSMPQNEASNITQPAENSDAASVTALKDTSVKAEQPNGDEVEVAEVFVGEAPAGGVSGNTAHNVDTEYTTTAASLPKTASFVPLLCLIGVLLIMAGAFLGIVVRRRRTS